MINKRKQVLPPKEALVKKEPLRGAFFWLSAFFVIYCARPEDWIPGLHYIPLAKLTSVFALLGLIVSVGKTKRRFRDLPFEGRLLLALTCLLILASLLSPVWKGGAVFRSLDFAKVSVVWILAYFVVTNLERLRLIIFVQTASVAVIAIVSVVRGYNTPRLEGVLGGIYNNPNDLAFAIVLSLPFAFMFLLQSRGFLRKLGLAFCLLAMATALFLTASRAGFIQFILAGSVCLWHFGVKRRRPLLILATFLVGAVLLVVAGGKIESRFLAISGEIHSSLDQSAYGSFEQRRELIVKSLEGMLHYPVLGIGVNNFTSYSGQWREVHNSYLQIGVEGGVIALILYLLFFGCGFASLRQLGKRRDLDPDTTLLVGALHSSLVGFVVGAMFAPEAYQFFPYFAVVYISTLVRVVRERKVQSATVSRLGSAPGRNLELYTGYRGSGAVTPARRTIVDPTLP